MVHAQQHLSELELLWFLVFLHHHHLLLVHLLELQQRQQIYRLVYHQEVQQWHMNLDVSSSSCELTAEIGSQP